ncbi:hypothetical protein HT031_004847 [Scenedesmus sp. PABB004]|nr:hypothetical protein HT031_004847 [Scenedesmus sp. PABB004]
MAGLLDRFQQTCDAEGIPEERRASLWQQIESRHSAADRHYHTLAHLACCFDFIRRAVKAGCVLEDPTAVDWAVWLHDAVLVPGSATNEADSAALAGELLLPAGVPPARVAKARRAGAPHAARSRRSSGSAGRPTAPARAAPCPSPICARQVQRYIAATSDHHHLPGEPDADLLMDADLAVLAAPLHRYVDAAAALRREAGHLCDADFTAERAKLLKGLLDREQLFLTDIGKATCEAAARANMAHEWRLVYGGQLLQANALADSDVEATDEEQSAAAASSTALEALEPVAEEEGEATGAS